MGTLSTDNLETALKNEFRTEYTATAMRISQWNSTKSAIHWVIFVDMHNICPKLPGIEQVLLHKLQYINI